MREFLPLMAWLVDWTDACCPRHSVCKGGSGWLCAGWCSSACSHGCHKRIRCINGKTGQALQTQPWQDGDKEGPGSACPCMNMILQTIEYGGPATVRLYLRSAYCIRVAPYARCGSGQCRILSSLAWHHVDLEAQGLHAWHGCRHQYELLPLKRLWPMPPLPT